MGTGQKKTKKRSYFAKYAAAAVLSLLVILVAGTSARYLRKDKSDAGQATANAFYFTTDLLGDSYMVDESGSAGGGSTYSFPDVQNGTFYLYGGVVHSITIQVQNFSDDMRITTGDITYTASVAVETPESSKAAGAVVSASGVELKKITGESNGDGTTEGGESGQTGSGEGTETYTLTGSAQASDTLNLTIPAYNAETNPYADGTVVTVQLESSSPYKKTIELDFVLYSTDTSLRYQVNDSVGSPYAELIIMTNVVSNASDSQTGGSAGGQTGGDTGTLVQPYLTWPNDLSIDNTNSLTYTYSEQASAGGNPFAQQPGMTDRNMQISQSLKPGESESIYFFKSDTSKNYSRSVQVVAPENNIYTINIGEAATTSGTGN